MYWLLPHTTKFETVNVQVLTYCVICQKANTEHESITLIFARSVRAFPYRSALFDRCCCSHAIPMLHVLRHRARGTRLWHPTIQVRLGGLKAAQ